ncbi:MAG: transglycosylase SLT domain-containing protein [Gemmobacter sp.]|nr:transglycosylase SLT domain-containing protein [Gemmobacter sp.]
MFKASYRPKSGHHPFCVTAVAAALLAVLPGGAPAAPGADPADLCDAAALQASGEVSVPADVMRAIALSETGRTRDGSVRPWAWALNEAGKGRWFDTRDAALTQLRAVLDTGARNVDVGCFQLNHRWHSEGFATLEQMIDPLANARYAARFLAKLHRETNDWSLAAGAYHSRTPEHASRYRARFDTILAALPKAPRQPPNMVARRGEAKPNRFPLLQAGPQVGGSLFPTVSGSGTNLLTAPLRPLFEKG